MKKIRKALVTGVTSGIGYAITEQFLTNNMFVIASGRSKNPPIFNNRDNKNICYYPTDLRQNENVENLFKFAIEKSQGVPDIMVVNAGVGLSGTLLTSDRSRWAELLDINCKSTFYQLKTIAELMLKNIKEDGNYKNNRKDIVIISSLIGRVVSEVNPVYGATKFALTSIAESLRKEICHSFVRVTVIEPGFVKTNFQERAGYDLIAFDLMEKEYGPFLTPQDIAAQVLFIVNQPSHVNISNIIIRPTRQKQ